jgi:hypothetical protein
MDGDFAPIFGKVKVGGISLISNRPGPLGSSMCKEELKLGRYQPESGSYVVEDDYTLVKDEKHKAPELIIETSAGYPELEDASFKVIKTFKFFDGSEKKIKFEISRVFIEGQFTVILNPKATISPSHYTKEDPRLTGTDRLYYRYDLQQLCDLSLPLVSIKGLFAHAKYQQNRCYDVTIRNAHLTQDLPGMFFAKPIERSTYEFIATDATIEPVTPY